MLIEVGKGAFRHAIVLKLPLFGREIVSRRSVKLCLLLIKVSQRSGNEFAESCE
jgi:hypothetical protein